MGQVEAKCMELAGTHYEIGYALGKRIAGIPALKAHMTSSPVQFDVQDAPHAQSLFDRWCPGLNEEIHGLADALGVDPTQASYYSMTFLKPRCSQMVLLPGLSENGHLLQARSYEFSHLYEDFTLARTSVPGKYTHLGTSVMHLGRDEGLNECGLAVTMSSCGFPVGAVGTMRKPALIGLQFWAVIRTLLENCKDVSEALSFLNGMPIAYNINLLMADKSAHAALVETIDGNIAIKRIDSTGPERYLHAANHALLLELKPYEPAVMRNSLQRYETIKRYLEGKNAVTAGDLKTLLLNKYPEGLSCHDYDGFFGTTKSIVMDLNDGSLELCWGGLLKNGWQRYRVAEPLPDNIRMVEIVQECPMPGFFDLV